MTAISRIIALFLVLAATPLAADTSDFPRPAELEPDISFWITIFTDYTSDQGVLHDNRNLFRGRCGFQASRICGQR